MQWEGREESSNVEDRRGISPGLVIGGGGGLILVILGLIFGVDFRQPGGNKGGDQPPPPAEDDKMAHFAKVVFGDTERVWDEQFQKMGKQYPKPTLVLFRGQVESACGQASAAVGPFYCPGDSKVYIDLSFYDTLERELGSPGEFARAYVLAHEVGHHVQRLLGYTARMEEAERTLPKSEHHKMSVRLELQADYLAGVWAYHAQKKFNFLEKGDLESATNAAFHIGDDVLQRQAGGRVRPDGFTHGTAEQRQRWFMKGFKTGDVKGAAQLFDLPYERL